MRAGYGLRRALASGIAWRSGISHMNLFGFLS